MRYHICEMCGAAEVDPIMGGMYTVCSKHKALGQQFTGAVEYLHEHGYSIKPTWASSPGQLRDFYIEYPGVPRTWGNAHDVIKKARSVRTHEDGSADPYYVDLTGLT